MRCSLAALASEGFPQARTPPAATTWLCLFDLASSGYTLPSPPARSPACPAVRKHERSVHLLLIFLLPKKPRRFSAVLSFIGKKYCNQSGLAASAEIFCFCKSRQKSLQILSRPGPASMRTGRLSKTRRMALVVTGPLARTTRYSLGICVRHVQRPLL
jgi:hypothetical protein